MYKYLITVFAVFMIAISVTGLMYPHSLLEVLTNLSWQASFFRIVLGILLIYYSWLGFYGTGYIKTALLTFGICLSLIFLAYMSGNFGFELRLFDAFFVTEGAVLALLAAIEKTPIAHKAQFNKADLSRRAELVKTRFLDYNNIK